jgi:hypothetical protein
MGSSTMYETLNILVTGAIAVCFFITGLFFLKFWDQTKDQLFLWFAIGFLVMCVNRVMLALGADEVRDYLYLIRLCAFSCILIAIVRKNLPRKG